MCQENFDTSGQRNQDIRICCCAERVSFKKSKDISDLDSRDDGELWDEVVVCIVLGSHQIWEITIQPTVFLTATKPSPT